MLEEHVKQDILNVLKGALKAVREENPIILRELSDHTIHNSSINQDPYSISTAILTYTLAKIFERKRYKEYKTWNFLHNSIIANLELAIIELERNNIEQYDHTIHLILQSVNQLDYKFKKYVKEILYKGKISKASRIYEHGISAGRTAQLFGISEWELMSYTGETGIPDAPYSQTKSMKERLVFVRNLFTKS